MKTRVKYPYTLTNAFFTTIHVTRIPEIPEPLKTELKLQTRIREYETTNRIQVDLSVVTENKAPVEIQIELIGLFDCNEEINKPEHGEVVAFVEQRALIMMWPMISQLLRQSTSVMGMPPMNLQMPGDFVLDTEETEST